jgi:hypothetical protein
MKLQDFAHWAEITASAAVIISLVVLIFEIRESTDTIRRASYESLLHSLREWRQDLATNSEFYRLYYAQMNTEVELDGEDLERVRTYLQALWLIYEQAYWANEYGDLGQAEWERFHSWICVGRASERSYRRRYWDEGPKPILSPAFVEYVEACRFPSQPGP